MAEPITPLEYESSRHAADGGPTRLRPSPARRVSAGVAGGFAAVLAAVMLFYGIGAAIFMAFASRRRVDAQDIFVVVMFVLIGAIAAYFAFRWLRTCYRDT